MQKQLPVFVVLKLYQNSRLEEIAFTHCTACLGGRSIWLQFRLVRFNGTVNTTRPKMCTDRCPVRETQDQICCPY